MADPDHIVPAVGPFSKRQRSTGHQMMCTMTANKLNLVEERAKTTIADHLNADAEAAMATLLTPIRGRDQSDIADILDDMRQRVADALSKQWKDPVHGDDSLSIARAFNVNMSVILMFAVQLKIASDRADELWRVGSRLEDQVRELKDKQEQDKHKVAPIQTRVRLDVARLFQDFNNTLRKFAVVQAKELQDMRAELQAHMHVPCKVDEAPPCPEPASVKAPPPSPEQAPFPGFMPHLEEPLSDDDRFESLLAEVQAFVPVDESMEPPAKRPTPPCPEDWRLSPVSCPMSLDGAEVASLYSYEL